LSPSSPTNVLPGLIWHHGAIIWTKIPTAVDASAPFSQTTCGLPPASPLAHSGAGLAAKIRPRCHLGSTDVQRGTSRRKRVLLIPASILAARRLAN
jgi:hypothetical protein